MAAMPGVFIPTDQALEQLNIFSDRGPNYFFKVFLSSQFREKWQRQIQGQIQGQQHKNAKN